MKNIDDQLLSLSSRIFIGGDHKPSQQIMVGVLLFMVFLLAVVCGGIMYFYGMTSYWSVFLEGGICLIGWLINRRGHVNIAAFLLIGSILVILQVNIFWGYGLHDVAITAWPAVIFLCGLLFGSRLLPYITAAVMLMAAFTRFTPNAGGFYGTADTGDLALVMVILLVFSLSIWIIIRRNESYLRQLQQSDERTQAIFNSVNDAIFILDMFTGKILDVNNKMQEMFGYTRQEAVQLDLEKISSGAAPYQRQNGLEWLQKASARGPQNFEWQAKDKNGRVFWVDVNMKIAVIGGERQAVVSVRDITDRKQAEAEIQSLNSELEERVAARTMALNAANQELESFAYSVSHDLRAPLRTLNGYSTILLEDYQNSLDEQGRQYLQRIKDASVRMGQLINDLLNLSRITRVDFVRQRFNLSELSCKIADDLKQQDPGRQVRFEIADQIIAQGDLNLIRIAMENLLGNAYKFTGHREMGVIRVGVEEQNGAPVYFVSDNGAGFDMAYADKLFAPFQRLHGAQEFPGTGIGLATVQRIISRHGGRIWAEGAVGQGATIYFTLNGAK